MKKGFHYIDLNKAGTNGYKTKVNSITILGLTLKTKVWINLAVIVAMMIFAAAVGYYAKQNEKKINMLENGFKVYAAVEPREYKAPPLAEQSVREQMIAVIKKVWRSDWETGVAIARCESGLRPDAFNGHNTNGTWDAGLFQVNQIHGISKNDLMNPYANAGYAYSIYKEQGTNPWTSSQACWGGNL